MLHSLPVPGSTTLFGDPAAPDAGALVPPILFAFCHLSSATLLPSERRQAGSMHV